MAETPLEVLQRWEQMGGTWQVVGRSGAEIEIALITCTGGEVVDRLISADRDLLAYIAQSPFAE